MKHQLPKLPYDLDALEPHMSKETLEYHYGKHHRAYIDKTNELIQGTKFEESPLEYIVKHADKGPLFNQAAQAWNHTFFWHSLSPDASGNPDGDLAEAIEKANGSFDKFQKDFGEKAAGLFGSGWVWLVRNPDGGLDIVQTANGGTPLSGESTPLIACDVWEHAYYLDHRNDRAKYVKAFWKLANWEFAAENFEKAVAEPHTARSSQQPSVHQHHSR
jgi:Fe-Mn family superoxide dismutase